MKRSLLFLSIYIIWNAIFKVLVLTLMTYFMSRSSVPFREISDTYIGNQIAVYGLSSGLFLIFIFQMNSLTVVSTNEVISKYGLKHYFFPAFLRGSFYSILLILPLILVGSHHFVGFLIQNDNLFSSVLTILFRLVTLLLLIYGEEFIFRYQWFQMDQNHNQNSLKMILVGALLFTLTKYIQFHLGFSQLLTMLFIGIYFGIRSVSELNFTECAGLWSGFLLFSHIVLSFPLFGNESQGLLFFQYTPHLEWNSTLTRIITGGAGGPLSSLALQLVLFLGIVYESSRNYKNLFGTTFKRLR